MIRTKSSLACFAVLCLVNLMWAFQFSGAKIATERLGPITVTLLPLLLSTAVFAPFMRVGRRTARGRAPARLFAGAAVAGGVGVVASQLGLTWGVQRSLASNAAVLTLTIPVLTAAMAAMLLKERMSLLRWVSFALAIAGVLLVSDIDWHSVAIFRGRYLFGNLLLFVSCLGSAFYNTYTKKLLEFFSPIEVLVYTFLAADAVVAVLLLIYEPPSRSALASLGLTVWLSLLAIALFSLSVSMLLYFWVIERIDVTQASLSIYLLPVFGVLLSTITLHERVTAHLIAGGLLVFASTFLVTTWEEMRKNKGVPMETVVQ